jgi:hypothetical protein
MKKYYKFCYKKGFTLSFFQHLSLLEKNKESIILLNSIYTKKIQHEAGCTLNH